MMEEELPFDYRVIWKDEYKNFHDFVCMTDIHERRKMEVVFEIDKYTPLSYPKIQKNCLLYAVEGERLCELLESYPKAEKIFKRYCFRQT